jgi:serine/threonine-protein kinase HipA
MEGVTRSDAKDIIERILARTPRAIEAVAAHLPSGFPERIAVTILPGAN